MRSIGEIADSLTLRNQFVNSLISLVSSSFIVVSFVLPAIATLLHPLARSEARNSASSQEAKKALLPPKIVG